jgi:hypothetical protein
MAHVEAYLRGDYPKMLLTVRERMIVRQREQRQEQEQEQGCDE